MECEMPEKAILPGRDEKYFLHYQEKYVSIKVFVCGTVDDKTIKIANLVFNGIFIT
jgi:hypothetical protein